VAAICCAAPIVLVASATVVGGVARFWPLALGGAIVLAVMLLRRVKRRSQ
jgi:hypothetical protein